MKGCGDAGTQGVDNLRYGLLIRLIIPALGREPGMDGLAHALCNYLNRRPLDLSALIGIAAALFSLIGAGPAFAQMQLEVPALTEGIAAAGPARPTQAWIEFCERLPGECIVDDTEPGSINLSPQIWSTIVEVNERVNSMILPVTDQDHFGVLDRWDYPNDGLGDCEDIQLLKRRLLVEIGLPRRALRMTVVADELGAGHAVMMVRTDRGDFILDNKRNAVLPWRQTGYIYLKREDADGSAWVALGEQLAATVTTPSS
jgi:predicted transglutaminase-like cysteine proteinase